MIVKRDNLLNELNICHNNRDIEFVSLYDFLTDPQIIIA